MSLGNERLIVLENRFKMFLLEVIVKTDGSPENHNEAYAKKRIFETPFKQIADNHGWSWK